MNEDVWRGIKGGYRYRPVFSDYGDDYAIIEFPNGEREVVDVPFDKLKQLINDANKGRI